jgi:hypothetical protein
LRREGLPVKAVFTHKAASIYDDKPEERYHFPETYLRPAQAAAGDFILSYEPGRVGAHDRDGVGRAYRRRSLIGKRTTIYTPFSLNLCPPFPRPRAKMMYNSASEARIRCGQSALARLSTPLIGNMERCDCFWDLP